MKKLTRERVRSSLLNIVLHDEVPHPVPQHRFSGAEPSSVQRRHRVNPSPLRNFDQPPLFLACCWKSRFSHLLNLVAPFPGWRYRIVQTDLLIVSMRTSPMVSLRSILSPSVLIAFVRRGPFDERDSLRYAGMSDQKPNK